MEERNLYVEVEDSMAIVTINRPEKRNAIDYDTQVELMYHMDSLDRNETVKVIILTGEGENFFAAGADIGKLRDRTPIESLESTMQQLTNHIAGISKPIIAAVNGYALGGGCELAIACDIRIVSKKAKIGLPELGLGIIPGGGGTQRLTALVGMGKAKELIFTGDIISAEEAEKIGLVNQVTEAKELLNTTKTIAKKIIKKAPIALKLAKLAIDQTNATSIQSGLQIEKLSQAVLMSTEDKLEGTNAFLEKRAPEFNGK
ncbi:enoyl-CoA hydratase/isomerase family protein [Oceanobacillus longus]|uniref:Enoyl-CoA hydratase/isomerase family protein n=1 Tax=Oceanobacillus longus TaxID=930120 RepID=A0ABV8GZL0_9BACI